MGSVKLGGTKFDIEKYDGRSDYLLWERQVQGALKATGLGKVLRSKPATTTDEDWKALQEQAVSIVLLYLQPHVLKQLGDFDDCDSLFAALQAKFHRKELSNRLFTSLKLISFKMKDSGTKIQDHIDAFSDLVIDLQNLGEVISDERKALHLLSSLPPSYQSLSRVLLHRDKLTITYDEVVTALLSDDIQQKMMVSSKPSSSSSGTALNVSRGRPRWKTNDRNGKRSGSKGRSKSREKSQERKTVTCWRCGKSGHIKKDCRVNVKASNPDEVNVAEDDEEDLLDDEADP